MKNKGLTAPGLLGLVLIVLFLVTGIVAGYNFSRIKRGDTGSLLTPLRSATSLFKTPSPLTPQVLETTTPLTPQVLQTPSPSKRIIAKGIYLTGWTAGISSRIDHFIEMADKTEINSFVIDIKDDDGYVGYESSVGEVRKYGTYIKKYNVDKIVEKLRKHNIHLIGRLACFKDPVYSKKRPDLAVKSNNGGLWRDRNGNTWLNPYKEDAWRYNIAIAKEALEKGFNEIQFDYVRFPNDGDKKAMNFGSEEVPRYSAIANYLDFAVKSMPGAIISADIFGIVCVSPGDTEKIGQYLEVTGKNIDYISPMVYPSHYAAGQIINGIRFAKPDLDPYNVIYNTLVMAKRRISETGAYKASVRPYIQDFTAKWLEKGYYKMYRAEDVRAQIKAVYDAGYNQWLCWNAENKYNEAAFLKEDYINSKNQ